MDKALILPLPSASRLIGETARGGDDDEEEEQEGVDKKEQDKRKRSHGAEVGYSPFNNIVSVGGYAYTSATVATR